MSEVLQRVWRLLKMQPLQASVYHPQSNGLVERLNGTLKLMLHKFVRENGRDWPQWVLFLFFVV